MKSLKDYSLNLPEKDYHAYPAWSYSMIARYAKEGFGAVAKLHESTEQNDAMRFGSLFDCMLTRPNDVTKEFEIGIKIPPAEKAVFDYLAQNCSAACYLEITDNELERAIAATNYQPRWKFQTQRDHLDEYAAYYNTCKSGKTIVTEDDWRDSVDMLNAVKNHEYLSKHFCRKSTDDVEYVYQAQFKVDYLTGNYGLIELKIMPDMLEVNHADKTIIPWDVKTSGAPGYDWWEENFVKMRYDIQAALYTDVLYYTIKKIPEYKDYKILPFIFMDISRTDKYPVAYEYDPCSDSQCDGLCFESNGRQVKLKNYRVLLDEILEYESTMTKVPSYITTVGPNDLIALLNNRKYGR